MTDCGFTHGEVRRATADQGGSTPPLSTVLRDELCTAWEQAAAAAHYARRTDGGSGSHWEMNGYATIIVEAMERIGRHRLRVERIDAVRLRNVS